MKGAVFSHYVKGGRLEIIDLVFNVEKHSLPDGFNLLPLNLEGTSTSSLTLLLLIFWASTTEYLEEVRCSSAHSRVYECLKLLAT